MATEEFLTGASFNLTAPAGNPSFGSSGSAPNDRLPVYYYGIKPSEITETSDAIYAYFKNMQESAPSWEKLEVNECLQAYASAFLSSRRNVILISSATSSNNSILDYGAADFDTGDYTENWWICSKIGNDGGHQTCNADQVSQTPWTVFDYPIEYCLSERVDSICSIDFSEKIMFVVIGFNAFKVLLMIWVLVRYDAEHILISVGDAAASFLRFEDQATGMMCLANKREMRKFWKHRGLARQYNRSPLRWGSAVSKKRWILFLLL